MLTSPILEGIASSHYAMLKGSVRLGDDDVPAYKDKLKMNKKMDAFFENFKLDITPKSTKNKHNKMWILLDLFRRYNVKLLIYFGRQLGNHPKDRRKDAISAAAVPSLAPVIRSIHRHLQIFDFAMSFQTEKQRHQPDDRAIEEPVIVQTQKILVPSRWISQSERRDLVADNMLLKTECRAMLVQLLLKYGFLGRPDLTFHGPLRNPGHHTRWSLSTFLVAIFLVLYRVQSGTGKSWMTLKAALREQEGNGLIPPMPKVHCRASLGGAATRPMLF